MNTQPAPYSTLTPDIILQAIDSIGLVTDGRLLALNSYENRVYQIGIENSAPVVTKFYRPNRWTTTAILEEHAFIEELASNEIPVVPPLKCRKTKPYMNSMASDSPYFRNKEGEYLTLRGVRNWNGWGVLSLEYMPLEH